MRVPSLRCQALALELFLAAQVGNAFPAELGANKVDLAMQFVNPAVPMTESALGYARVRTAMAEKAIADAHDAGLPFLRVAVTGYWPFNFGDEQNDLALWQQDPATYWRRMDRMFDTLDRAGIQIIPSFLWQTAQFAVLGGDTLQRFVSEPASQGRRLFAQYLRDFISRYKSRRTVLFYELTNEMNLEADTTLKGHCNKDDAAPCVWDRFSTDDMNRFAQNEVSLIKQIDPSRKVSSGYAAPRTAAWHLMRRPEFGPSGPDWTADSLDEFRRYLTLVHGPFDVISAHIYAGSEHDRFGWRPGEEHQLVSEAAVAAAVVKKPLFIGEFGDAGATPFVTNVLRELVHNHVEYAAIWVWELYQNSTYRTHDTAPSLFSIEPGDGGDLIRLLIKTERELGMPPLPSSGFGGAPRVVLTWPLPCAMVDRPINLYAVASAGARAVRKVAFLVDGSPAGTAQSFPYSIPFDPTGLGRRLVEIEARAFDISGTVSRFKSSVRLNRTEASCSLAE